MFFKKSLYHHEKQLVLAVLQLSVLPQRWLLSILMFASQFKKGEKNYFSVNCSLLSMGITDLIS